MQALKEAGLIVPDEIPTNDDSVPLDFTTLSNQAVGGIQSRYAVRHSHAIFHAALAATRLVHLKRDLRLQQAKFRVRHSDEKKTLVDALMEEDKHIAKRLLKIADAEAYVQVVEAVAQGYEDLRNAASREMSRRSSERAQVD